MTKIFLQNELNSSILEKVSNSIRNSGIVVFPTETVYGLGANAFDENAVKKIFIAKGRPADNPLIVHIWDENQVFDIAEEVPDIFYLLAKEFWPGPLTMIVKKNKNIPDIVSGGLDSIGIRMPSHPIAYELLKKCNLPIAAPSANISGRPSPTNLKYAVLDMEEKADFILDGGECDIGVESTVLDLTVDVPVILRPGAVTYEELKKVIGNVEVDSHIFNVNDITTNPKSPGMKYRHYAPNAKILMFDGEIFEVIENICYKFDELSKKGLKVGILCTEQTKKYYKFDEVICMGDRNNPVSISKKLFSSFRDFDERMVDVILMEGIDRNGIGMAIVNRMLRAVSK